MNKIDRELGQRNNLNTRTRKEAESMENMIKYKSKEDIL